MCTVGSEAQPGAIWQDSTTSAVKEQKQTLGLMITNIHALEMLLLNLKYMGVWSGGCTCTVATYECIRRIFEKSVGSENHSSTVLSASWA